MISNRSMQNVMTLILLIGTFIAIVLVLTGGALFLLKHGGQLVDYQRLEASHFNITIRHLAFTATPLFLVQLGLLTLVATQILRVLLLVLYYGAIRDYKFTLISFFILIILLYSFIAQK